MSDMQIQQVLSQMRSLAQSVRGIEPFDSAGRIAGKGHETYQVIAGRKVSFDDRLEAAKALSKKEVIEDDFRMHCNVTDSFTRQRQVL